MVEAKQAKLQAMLDATAGNATKSKQGTTSAGSGLSNARTAALAEKIAASQKVAQAEEEARLERIRQQQAAREARMKVRKGVAVENWSVLPPPSLLPRLPAAFCC